MKLLLLAIGNPGNAYTFTRHNLGVLVLLQLIKLYDSNFKVNGNSYEFLYKGHEIIVQWTVSYVNTTGGPLGLFMNKNNIQPHQLMVFFDNLELDFGQWKYSFGFGTSGHNGLKSIKNSLGGQSYHRIGLGIGHPGDNVSQYVLEKLPKSQLDRVYDVAYDLYKDNILEKLIEKNS